MFAIFQNQHIIKIMIVILFLQTQTQILLLKNKYIEKYCFVQKN
jgi:hypothetical protein